MSIDTNAQKLLKDKRVVEEINRHLWIESEKVGYDIGFERASQDWLQRFSKAWMEYHLPKKESTSSSKEKNIAIAKTATRTATRRAARA